MKELIVFVVVTVLISGCVSTPQPSVMYYTMDKFPPTSEVQILHVTPQNRPFIEIGEVSVRINRASENTAVALLRKKAGEMGADALLIVGERYRGSVGVPAGGMIVSLPVKDLYGIAIKYK